ncbi:unnamed protein product, partial [Prorocentrum cordatum]
GASGLPTPGQLYAEFASLMGEGLGGLFDWGTWRRRSTQAQGPFLRGREQAARWRHVGSLPREMPQARRRLRFEHRRPRELALLSALQGKLGRLAAKAEAELARELCSVGYFTFQELQALEKHAMAVAEKFERRRAVQRSRSWCEWPQL